MAQPGDKTVLVVDDEEGVRLYLQTALEDAGFKVETAADGLEALDKLKTSPPDAISLDLVMPKKSGARFLYELRKNKQWQRIPVILVTAHAKDELGKKDFDEIMEGRMLSGPETYLEKPVKADTYVNSIKRVLGIEITPGGSEPDAKDLKQELRALLEGADKEKLEKALKALKDKS